ncbi:hypothetical protein BDR26DRAFT_852486 [Obelidium mucronatum]|nr:hypothetical protein BDR26DRAFT_852486 [Obelidium mucronatum]
MEGAGTAGIWGFSPAIDLFSSVVDESGLSEANFLLMGTKDARHVIKTIAHIGRHKEFKGNLNFYVHEDQAPILARTILLLSIFLDQETDVSDMEQTQLFLEVFGNIYLREKSYQTVKQLATKLLILLGDSEGSLAPLFNFSHLRFKDRDDLEVVFKFWRDDVKKVYEIDKLWDTRLRKMYGVRYDVRENIVDWDYHMKLTKEVTIIHKTEFLRWRQHGLVYEVRDSSYDKPNRTTATVDFMKQDGVSVTKWGYFNDVITGPFISFGIESEKKELIEKTNEQHTHPSSEVSEYNVHAYMEEYKKTFSSLNSLLSRVKVHILPPTADPFPSLQKQTRKKSLKFHAIFLSNASAQYIQKIPHSFVSSETQVHVETARYMLDLKAEQVTAFQDKILEIAKPEGFHPLKKYDKHVDVVVLQADGLESQQTELSAQELMKQNI